MRRLLSWIVRRRLEILAFAAALVALYGILLVVIPKSYAHDAGYVFASIIVLLIVAVDAALWRERRR